MTVFRRSTPHAFLQAQENKLSLTASNVTLLRFEPGTARMKSAVRPTCLVPPTP
jgi:hypothetical protein